MIGPKKKLWGVWISDHKTLKNIQYNNWVDMSDGVKYFNQVLDVFNEKTNAFPNYNYSLIPFNPNRKSL